jgi:hypothetical protein
MLAISVECTLTGFGGIIPVVWSNTDWNKVCKWPS